MYMRLEDKRQAIHFALGFFAFLIPFISRPVVFLLLLILLVIAVVIVPYSGLRHHIYRDSERHYSEGALWYFTALLSLAIVAPLSTVAASWVVLAFGDGAATLLGHRVHSPRLPWHGHKSWAGSLGFVVFAFLGVLVILRMTMPYISDVQLVGISIITAIIAAIIETIPWKINDNVAIVGAAALTITILLAAL